MRCSSCNAREKSVINLPGSGVHLLGYTQGWYYVVTGVSAEASHLAMWAGQWLGRG